MTQTVDTTLPRFTVQPDWPSIEKDTFWLSIYRTGKSSQHATVHPDLNGSLAVSDAPSVKILEHDTANVKSLKLKAF